MSVILYIGNITFHHFEEEEKKLFKKDTEQRALVHEILVKVECKDVAEAHSYCEEVGDSWIIPSVFEKDGHGEIVFECQDNNLPISVQDFINDYIK